jgi:hypothetical protein
MPSGAPLQHLLHDRAFWRSRLERLDSIPRHLVLFPRPDLGRPGVDVIELRLRAHDGRLLHALLGRVVFYQGGGTVRLRPCETLDPIGLDWEAIDGGETDVLFAFPPDRRLEDRVLDTLRILRAACSIEGVDCAHVRFGCRDEGSAPPDELRIARLLRDEGWLSSA